MNVTHNGLLHMIADSAKGRGRTCVGLAKGRRMLNIETSKHACAVFNKLTLCIGILCIRAKAFFSHNMIFFPCWVFLIDELFLVESPHCLHISYSLCTLSSLVVMISSCCDSIFHDSTQHL